jgi:DNA-binding NarL/FixJ family response regulator
VTSIRVIVADDHTLVRQGIVALLAGAQDIDVVGEAATLADVEPLLAEIGCDVLLLDLRLERYALSDIPGFADRTRVVALTASDDLDEALTVMRAGARGVVFKSLAVDTLREAIRTAHAGQAWMPPALQAHVVAGLQHAGPDVLTRRERDIVRHVGLGLRNADIARRLFVSEQTVKTHLNNIFRKLGIRERVQLARYAVRTGLVGVHEES